jgi:hypothetical protein
MKKKILLILIPLLLIGGGIFALTRKKKPAPPIKKKKPATIIIGDITGEVDAFADYPSGNYFFVKVGAEMWSYPSTVGSDLIRTYEYEDSVNGLQTGNFNGEVWIQVDDFDNVGWVKESDLFQKNEYGSVVFGVDY